MQLPLTRETRVLQPALFHGAGANLSTTVRRMANLSRCPRRSVGAMESVDRVAMCRALFPVLLESKAAGAPTAT